MCFMLGRGSQMLKIQESIKKHFFRFDATQESTFEGKMKENINSLIEEMLLQNGSLNAE